MCKFYYTVHMVQSHRCDHSMLFSRFTVSLDFSVHLGPSNNISVNRDSTVRYYYCKDWEICATTTGTTNPVSPVSSSPSFGIKEKKSSGQGTKSGQPYPRC